MTKFTKLKVKKTQGEKNSSQNLAENSMYRSFWAQCGSKTQNNESSNSILSDVWTYKYFENATLPWRLTKFRGDFQKTSKLNEYFSKTQAFFSKLNEFSQNSSNFFKNSRILAQKLNGPELLSPVILRTGCQKKKPDLTPPQSPPPLFSTCIKPSFIAT